MSDLYPSTTEIESLREVDRAPTSSAALRFHTLLAAAHQRRLAPALGGSLRDELARDHAARIAEATFVERERLDVAARARKAPRDAAGFVAWFEALRDDGPGQGDPLFPWLARHATLDQLRWFLRQEVAGEAGFDDLVALTQVKLPVRAKLELARNYWDEMGQGNASGMHGPMLGRLAEAMDLGEGVPIVWESLALGNLLVALATNRRWAYQSLGALGVVELTAPGRAAMVSAGLERVGVPGNLRRYYAVHATLDVKHARAWISEVLVPVVSVEPQAAQALAEGALMRLEAGRRCFVRYRKELAPSLR